MKSCYVEQSDQAPLNLLIIFVSGWLIYVQVKFGLFSKQSVMKIYNLTDSL